MTPTLVGGILGGLAAVGFLLAVLASPPLRRPTLADRIAPTCPTRRASRVCWPAAAPAPPEPSAG